MLRIQIKRVLLYSITAILLAAGCPHLKAQEIFNLQQCLELAIERNYDVKISKNEEEIARNNVSWGNAGYLPTITGNAGFSGGLNNYDRRNEVTNHNTHNEGFNANVGLTWKIFDGFNMSATYDKLKELEMVGELSTKLGVETLSASTAAMYYDVVQQQIKLRNLKQSMELSRLRLRIAQEKFHLGARSRLEVLQAEVDFNADSSTYVNYIENIKQTKIKMKQLLHIPFEQEIDVADTTLQIFEELEFRELEDLVLERNTSLQIYNKNRTISALEKKQVESARYPYLNFNTSYGFNGINNSNTSNTTTLGLSYGLTLGIKIYDGANQRRLEKNVRILQENRELEYKRQEQQIMADLNILYSSYQNYIKLLQLEEHNTELAEQKVELAMEQYRLGQITSLEIREFQRTLLDAQDRLVSALYQAKYAEIYIMQLCGMTHLYLAAD